MKEFSPYSKKPEDKVPRGITKIGKGKDKDGVEDGVFYTEIIKPEEREEIENLGEQIINQNEDSKKIFSQLTKEELDQFYFALTLHYRNTRFPKEKRLLQVRLDKDNRIIQEINKNNVYLFIELALKHNRNFLKDVYTLERLYKEAQKYLEIENQLSEVEDFAKFLIKHIKSLNKGIIPDEESIRELFRNLAQRRELKNCERVVLAFLKGIGIQPVNKENNSEFTPYSYKWFKDKINQQPIIPIASFEYIDHKGEKQKIQIVELNNFDSFQEESKALDHCLGNSRHYFEKKQAGTHKYFSLRDAQGNILYTIEYQTQDNTILQFKGKRDILPEDYNLISATFKSLENSGYKIRSVKERFKKIITYQEGEFIIKDNLTSEDIDEFLSKEKEFRIICGAFEVPGDISWEALEKLIQIEGLTLDLTQVPQEMKDRITSIKGSLIDRGEKVSYKLLQSVGGYLNVHSATTLELPQLQSVGGDLYTPDATTLELPQLQSVGGSLDASSATTLNLPQLQSVGGDLRASKAITLYLSQLKLIGKDLYILREYLNIKEFIISEDVSINGKKYDEYCPRYNHQNPHTFNKTLKQIIDEINQKQARGNK